MSSASRADTRHQSVKLRYGAKPRSDRRHPCEWRFPHHRATGLGVVRNEANGRDSLPLLLRSLALGSHILQIAVRRAAAATAAFALRVRPAAVGLPLLAKRAVHRLAGWLAFKLTNR